jgi:hypothetical protein
MKAREMVDLINVGLFLFGILTLGIFATAVGVDSRPGFDDPRQAAGGIDF